jgi:hypothetical protein
MVGIASPMNFKRLRWPLVRRLVKVRSRWLFFPTWLNGIRRQELSLCERIVLEGVEGCVGSAMQCYNPRRLPGSAYQLHGTQAGNFIKKIHLDRQVANRR